MPKQCARLCTAFILLASATGAQAGNILFAHVDDYAPYVDDGNRIADFLSNAGHSVTTRYLDAAVYDDYDSFDQVFVYDLYSGNDTGANQNENYQNIADWYNGLDDQNLILDGRIISSDIDWVNPPEEAWIQNYATQLELRGGGLVLGTDHFAFQIGINSINNLIGIDEFTGIYTSPPLEATVDKNSPLYIPTLAVCSFDPSQQCINDNSSTGFVATGLQANGQTLTPVAYHGNQLDAWDFAAVSSTMGSITFGTCGEPGQPPCSVPEPSPLILLSAGLALMGAARKFKIRQRVT